MDGVPAMTKNAKFNIVVVVMIVSINVISGCTNATLRFTDVQQPVMLGSPRQIGGGDVKHSTPFGTDIATVSSRGKWGILLPFPFMEDRSARKDPSIPILSDYNLHDLPTTPPDDVIIRNVAFKTLQAGIFFIFPPIGPLCGDNSIIELQGSIFTIESHPDKQP